MYQIYLDICNDSAATNHGVVAELKRSLRGKRIAVGDVDLSGEWPEVRLRCGSRARLQAWLDAHGFEDRTTFQIDRVTFVAGEEPTITPCRYTEDELINNTTNVPHADLVKGWVGDEDDAVSFFIK